MHPEGSHHDATVAGAAPRDVRPPTGLLREFLEVSEEFERVLAAELTVNPTDLAAMQHLVMSGPLRATELAGRLRMSTAATTSVIDRLEVLGHATRAVDPHDRRVVLVVPTPSSRARAAGRIVGMILDVDSVLDDFTADEQEVIHRYLDLAVRAYRAHLGVEPGADEPTA